MVIMMLKNEKYKGYIIKFKKIKGWGIVCRTKFKGKMLYFSADTKQQAFSGIKTQILLSNESKEGKFPSERHITRRFNLLWDTTR